MPIANTKAGWPRSTLAIMTISMRLMQASQSRQTRPNSVPAILIAATVWPVPFRFWRTP